MASETCRFYQQIWRVANAADRTRERLKRLLPPRGYALLAAMYHTLNGRKALPAESPSSKMPGVVRRRGLPRE